MLGSPLTGVTDISLKKKKEVNVVLLVESGCEFYNVGSITVY
jgi:hypothetical protein